jgi:hypothetical protein
VIACPGGPTLAASGVTAAVTVGDGQQIVPLATTRM